MLLKLTVSNANLKSTLFQKFNTVKINVDFRNGGFLRYTYVFADVNVDLFLLELLFFKKTELHLQNIRLENLNLLTIKQPAVLTRFRENGWKILEDNEFHR